MKILLKKATLINDKSVFHNKKVDILIDDGLLSKIDNNIDVKADQLINLEELYVSSGWFDPNISFGEPGFEERERHWKMDYSQLLKAVSLMCF